jgi:aspartate racemase
VLVLCTNTMHKVVDVLIDGLDIPVLHLADTTAAAVRAAGLDRVGLLGTAFTMEQDFYTGRLAEHGLDVLVPDADERADVHRIIYEELVVGIVTEPSRQRYREVIDSLVARGAQGVILGCTEIELLVGPADSPVPVFPTTRLHAEAAVDHALSGFSPEAAAAKST